MKKGSYIRFCKKCNTERILLNNGRYICPKCSREASLKHYHNNKKPLTPEQKEKKRKSNLKWKHTIRDSGFTNQQITMIKSRYGLCEKDLVKLVDKQNCKCSICSKELNKNRNTEKDKSDDLCIDHNHITGSIRGLLCRDCNLAIGMFKDNIELLNNAIKYLKENHTQNT